MLVNSFVFAAVNIFDEEGEPTSALVWAPVSTEHETVLAWQGQKPSWSVNNREAFQTSFHSLTGGVFDAFDEDDWSNIVVAGGIVLASLLDYGSGTNVCINSEYPNSDVDLFIYGLDESAAKEKLRNVYTKLNYSTEICCVRTPHTLTYVTDHRNVQCILRLHSSAEEVIEAFDVDCCGVYYDGEAAVATRRAVAAIATGCNIADYDRRSWSYETRLIKYSRRGFGVAIKDAPPDFRGKIAWLFEDMLPEQVAEVKESEKKKTKNEDESGGSGGGSSSSSYYRRREKEAYTKNDDKTIPQLFEDWERFEVYFDGKGVMKLIMAEYLRAKKSKLALETTRKTWIPNGMFGSDTSDAMLSGMLRGHAGGEQGVVGAALLISSIGEAYGPCPFWPGSANYAVSRSPEQFLATRSKKKASSVRFEHGGIPTGDAIHSASSQGTSREDWLKGIYRTTRTEAWQPDKIGFFS